MKNVKKIIKIITDIVFVLIIIVMAVIYVPGLAGFKSYRVLSASMEPEYHVGSMVYVKKVAEDEIKTGDVITFYVNDNTLVTHRVVGRDSDNGGFITRGDANEVNDGGVALFDNIVGKVVINIPLLGYILSWIGTLYGKCIVISLLLIMTLMCYLLEAGTKQKESGKIA